MARLFLTNVDLNKNQLLNAALQNLTTPPPSPVTAQMYFDTNDVPPRAYIYDGTAWVVLGEMTAAEILADLLTVDGAGSGLDADLLDAQNGTYYLARANHTGTQAASTISDFDTQVRTSRLDQMAAPTVSVSMNSQRITSVADGTAANDVVNKGQLDAVSAGLAPKDSVVAATTAAGTLATSFANASVVDGVTLATGDRILIKNQAAGAENGIYVVQASGAPVRATDADTAAELRSAYTFVEKGTQNADTGWVLTTDDITLGTTALNFTQFTGMAQLVAGAGITKTGNTVDVGAGTGIQVNADTVAVERDESADGGAAIRVPLIYWELIGDGAATSIAVTHNLGTKRVIVQVARASDDVEVECDVTRTSTTVVTLGFAVAPAADAFYAVIMG